MKTITAVKDMQEFATATRREGKRVALVPTMGALHEGHVKLLRHGRMFGDLLVMSLFVNPTQFNDPQDLKKYPRDLEGDAEKAAKAGVDLLFAPTEAEIYPQGHQTFVEVPELARELCGASRPGHFRGIATICTKLFHIVEPHVAVFGEKDYQQLLIIKQLVKDLKLPIQVIGVPTVREKDGLALSSRNTLLSPTGRSKAATLYRALKEAYDEAVNGDQDLGKIQRRAEGVLAKEAGLEIDYLEIREATTLYRPKALDRPLIMAVAAKIEGIRLIDNILLPAKCSPK